MANLYRSELALWLSLLLIVWLSPQTTGQNSEFIPASSDNCACPNQIQTYTCTVVGGGSTVWTGSALSTCSESEIILLHTGFADRTAMETCNNGAIIGQGLRVDGNRYTSELRVNSSIGLNNTAVRCLNAELATVGEASINVISGAFDTRLQQPTVVSSMAGVQLNFTWTAVNLNCTSVDSYQITASDCGNCPVTTETTMAICSGLQMPAVCRFSVRSVVCGDVGMPSNEVTVSVRVPEQPQVAIIPVYTAAMQLVRLNITIINQHNSMDNSGSVFEAVTNYSISYGDTATSTFARNTSCVTDACMYMLDVPSEVCSSLDHANVTLSASNVFGVGSSSNVTVIGCTNQFVRVEYNRDSSVITCTFLDQQDTSIKSCTVTYGLCNEELVNTVQRNSTEETPNRISLQVNGNTFECYTVTASSATSSVIVEETNARTDPDSNRLNIVAIVVPIVIVVILIIITVIVLIVLLIKTKKHTEVSNKSSTSGTQQPKEDLSQKDTEDGPFRSTGQ